MGPVINRGTRVSQHTRTQGDALNRDRGWAIVKKAIYTADEQKEFIQVQVLERVHQRRAGENRVRR